MENFWNILLAISEAALFAYTMRLLQTDLSLKKGIKIDKIMVECEKKIPVYHIEGTKQAYIQGYARMVPQGGSFVLQAKSNVQGWTFTATIPLGGGGSMHWFVKPTTLDNKCFPNGFNLSGDTAVDSIGVSHVQFSTPSPP